MTNAILRITNGEDVIDFLTEKGQGFYLSKWRPVTADFKGGGVYQGSDLTDNRAIVNARYDNVTEQIEVKLLGDTQDSAIELLRNLIKIGALATQNWISNYLPTEFTEVTTGGLTVNRAGRPVWIEARAACETNIRYATIVKARIPELENPYGIIFNNVVSNNSAMDELTLVVERMHWQSVPPGRMEKQRLQNYTQVQMTDLPSSWGGMVADSMTPEGVPVPNDGRFSCNVCNKETNVLLDYIYRFSGGAFSGNFQGVAYPVTNLFSGALGTVLYFGTVPTNGLFSNIVFNIGQSTQAGGAWQGIWEYWNGATWVALPVVDRTISNIVSTWSRLGHGTVAWRHPVDWVPVIVNAVNAYWVRWRLTVLSLPPGLGPWVTFSAPRIYTSNFSWFEVPEGDVGGEIPALIQVEFEDVSDDQGDSLSPPALFVDRVIVGLRSNNRQLQGLDVSPFVSHLNSVQGNPTDVVLTAGVNVATVTSNFNSIGYVARWTEAAISPMQARYTWEIPYPTGVNWFGTFRVFARIYRETSGVADPEDMAFRMKITLGQNYNVFTSETKVCREFGAFNLLDFGSATVLPEMLLGSENPFAGNTLDIVSYGYAYGATVKIILEGEQVEANPNTADIIDIILIPADEMIVEAVNNNFTEEQSLGYAGTSTPSILVIDSANYWRNVVRSILYRRPPLTTPLPPVPAQMLEVLSVWQTNAAQPVIAQLGISQKYFTLTARKYDPLVSIDDWRSNPEQLMTVTLNKAQRYLTMRGNG